MTEGRTGGEGTLIESLLKRKNKIHKKHKCSRNGSPWLENQQLRIQNSLFFVPELMVAAVLLKTSVFDQFLNFLFFDFFRLFGMLIEVGTIIESLTVLRPVVDQAKRDPATFP